MMPGHRGMQNLVSVTCTPATSCKTLLFGHRIVPRACRTLPFIHGWHLGHAEPCLSSTSRASGMQNLRCVKPPWICRSPRAIVSFALPPVVPCWQARSGEAGLGQAAQEANRASQSLLATLAVDSDSGQAGRRIQGGLTRRKPCFLDTDGDRPGQTTCAGPMTRVVVPRGWRHGAMEFGVYGRAGAGLP